jgi:hypothetical protein
MVLDQTTALVVNEDFEGLHKFLLHIGVLTNNTIAKRVSDRGGHRGWAKWAMPPNFYDLLYIMFIYC